MTKGLGRRLKDVRKLLGWSLREAASEVGVSAQMISLWERGIKVPTSGRLRDLARAYGTSCGALLPGPWHVRVEASDPHEARQVRRYFEALAEACSRWLDFQSVIITRGGSNG